MSVTQIGLVDATGSIDPQLVLAAAAAINVQVIRDLPQFWAVTATVGALNDPNQIPAGVWPVFVVAKLPKGEGGVHLDRNNQPFALVVHTPNSDDWTIDASHEIVEMLVDPAGNRLQTSQAIQIEGKDVEDAVGQFSYLVEACDPCEGNAYAYGIQGIAVSDFITPHYYDPVVTVGTRYSFAGNVQRPRQILPGGYISFIDPQSNEVQQILFLDQQPQLRDLGPANGLSLRAFVDGKTRQLVHESRKQNTRLTERMRSHRESISSAARSRAKMYRGKYESLIRR